MQEFFRKYLTDSLGGGYNDDKNFIIRRIEWKFQLLCRFTMRKNF
jgi:hypothetical protein